MQELVSNNISYSLLKSFDENGPRVLIERKNVKTKSTEFGNRLDDFISLSTEEFNEKYLIVQNKIEGDLLILAQNVAKSIKIEYDENNKYKKDTTDAIIKIISYLDLFKRIKKDETRILKFNNKEFYDLVDLIKSYPKKEFITPTEYSKLIECRSALYNHKSTKSYFNCEGNIEEIYQAEINYEYLGRNIKVILDKIIINHDKLTIQGLDLKSGSPATHEFIKNFFTYKYYIQGALYIKALNQYIIDRGLYGYTICPFKYIYQPTFDFNNPKVFVLTKKWIRAAFDGFTTNSGYKYRGIDELIIEINWHINNQVFNETKEFHENNEIYLDDSFIHVE